MKLITLIILLIPFINSPAQENQKYLTGSLKLDSFRALNEVSSNAYDDNSTLYEQDKKSPLLAGLLSFALPGAGEFYAESYWKSAIFIVAEAAAITVGIIYDTKGDDQTNLFESFANENWSAVRYAEWTVDHASQINSNVNPSDYNVFDQNHNLNWRELNRLEQAIGSWYSHQLAPYGDQQYYEMIGKYSQFNVGWDDFEGGDFQFGDPLTENFLNYAKMRGKANDFYSVAKTAVIIVIVNHVLSAIDAALTAKWFNDDLKVNLNLESKNLGYKIDYYPRLSINYVF